MEAHVFFPYITNISWLSSSILLASSETLEGADSVKHPEQSDRQTATNRVDVVNGVPLQREIS